MESSGIRSTKSMCSRTCRSWRRVVVPFLSCAAIQTAMPGTTTPINGFKISSKALSTKVMSVILATGCDTVAVSGPADEEVPSGVHAFQLGSAAYVPEDGTILGMKRIAAQAYQALREALPAIHWNKWAFESFLRDALREHPELLVGLDFNGPTKRETADALVNRLIADEPSYQRAILGLMMEVSGMSRFSNIERMKDAEDRALRLREANDTAGRLRVLVAPYRDQAEASARSAAERQTEAAKQAGIRQFSDELASLQARYLEMRDSKDPHQRGRDFERLLHDLFLLFDMEPRLSYVLDHEQIDGSLSFDTDDYIVEARWRKAKAEPEDLDKLKAKVERKSRNTLGVFVSVEGFTAGALAIYSTKSPFVVFNGDDIYLVLDGSIRLDELMRAKKRHVNETGDCFLSARRLLNSTE